MKRIGIAALLMIAWPIFAPIILVLSAIACIAFWLVIPFCLFTPDGGGEFQAKPFWIGDGDGQ